MSLSWLKKIFDHDDFECQYVLSCEQCADIFTKELAPHKWANALSLLGMDTSLSEKYSVEVIGKPNKASPDKASGTVAPVGDDAAPAGVDWMTLSAKSAFLPMVLQILQLGPGA